ncbi:MAG: LysE family translocator [bacterium]|nr:LysE family translocator [bacterium]
MLIAHARFGRIVLLAFVTGFSGAIMPGPLLVAVIEQTPLQGIGAMAGLITGHAILEFILLVFLILGLRSAISRPSVRAAIGLIGGTALFYMSCDMLRHGWQLTLNLGAQAGVAYSWPKLMILGAVICAANPYFTGWWATIGVGQLAQMSPRTTTEYLGFYLGHEAADYAWYGLVSLIIITGRRWITDGVYQSLILGCGAILMVLSLWFFYTGVRLMRRRPRIFKLKK